MTKHDQTWLDREKVQRERNNYGSMLETANGEQPKEFETAEAFAKRYHEHMKQLDSKTAEHMAWKTWFLMSNKADVLYNGYFTYECNWGFDYQPEMGDEGHIIIYSDAFNDIVKTIPFSGVVEIFKSKFPEVYEDDWRLEF